jgi:hypothetical protein
MVVSSDDVRSERIMLEAIQRELGIERGVLALRGAEECRPWFQTNLDLLREERRPLIAVGTYGSLAPIIGVEEVVLVIRSSREEAKQVARLRSRRTTALPEPR